MTHIGVGEVGVAQPVLDPTLVQQIAGLRQEIGAQGSVIVQDFITIVERKAQLSGGEFNPSSRELHGFPYDGLALELPAPNAWFDGRDFAVGVRKPPSAGQKAAYVGLTTRVEWDHVEPMRASFGQRIDTVKQEMLTAGLLDNPDLAEGTRASELRELNDRAAIIETARSTFDAAGRYFVQLDAAGGPRVFWLGPAIADRGLKINIMVAPIDAVPALERSGFIPATEVSFPGMLSPEQEIADVGAYIKLSGDRQTPEMLATYAQPSKAWARAQELWRERAATAPEAVATEVSADARPEELPTAEIIGQVITTVLTLANAPAALLDKAQRTAVNAVRVSNGDVEAIPAYVGFNTGEQAEVLEILEQHSNLVQAVIAAMRLNGRLPGTDVR